MKLSFIFLVRPRLRSDCPQQMAVIVKVLKENKIMKLKCYVNIRFVFIFVSGLRNIITNECVFRPK